MTKKTRTKAVDKWIKAEVREQRARYKQIAQAMNVEIAGQRDEWIGEFFERIQARGFNVHADIRRPIKPEEIPTQPKRKFKVVF